MRTKKPDIASRQILVLVAILLSSCSAPSQYFGVPIGSTENRSPTCDEDRLCYKRLPLRELAFNASKGDKVGQFVLAQRFEQGRGLSQNLDSALELYAKAAANEMRSQTAYVSSGNGIMAEVSSVGVQEYGLIDAKVRRQNLLWHLEKRSLEIPPDKRYPSIPITDSPESAKWIIYAYASNWDFCRPGTILELDRFKQTNSFRSCLFTSRGQSYPRENVLDSYEAFAIELNRDSWTKDYWSERFQTLKLASNLPEENLGFFVPLANVLRSEMSFGLVNPVESARAYCQTLMNDLQFRLDAFHTEYALCRAVTGRNKFAL